MKSLLRMALGLLFICCPMLASAADMGGFSFLKISGPDARAVVKTPQGEKQLVAPGDFLGDMKVEEIVEDRVVLEPLDQKVQGVLIVRIQDGKQHISSLQQRPLKQKAVSVDAEPATKQFSE